MRSKCFVLLVLLLSFLWSGGALAVEESNLVKLEDLALQNSAELNYLKQEYRLLLDDYQLWEQRYVKDLQINISSNYDIFTKNESPGSTQIDVSKQLSEKSRINYNQSLLEEDEVDLLGRGVFTYQYQITDNFNQETDNDLQAINQQITIMRKRAEIENKIKSVKKELVDNYYNYLTLKQELRNQQVLLTENERTKERVKNLIRQGERAEVDLLEINIALLENKLAVEDIQVKLLQTKDELKMLTGLDELPEIKALNEMLTWNLSKDKYVKYIINSQISLEIMEKKIKLQNLVYQGVKSANRPEVNLQAKIAVDDERKFPADYGLYFNVNYNFDNYQNSKRENKEESILLTIKNLQDEKQKILDDIWQMTDKQYQNLDSKAKRIDLLDNILLSSAREVEIARMRYEQGIISLADYLQKQSSYYRKKINYNATIIEYNKEVINMMIEADLNWEDKDV